MKQTKRIALAGLCLLMLAGCTTAKRTVFLEMPPEADPEAKTTLAVPEAAPLDLAAYTEKYGEHDAVYLLIEQSVEHYGNRERGVLDTGRWYYSAVHHHKYIIFNPDDERLTTFQRSYVPDNMYVRVTSPDGRVWNYGPEDLRDGLDGDGDKSYTIVYQDIVPGTLVEMGWDYWYTLGYPSQLEHDFDLRYRWPCERSVFTFACPDWWELGFKDTGLDTDLPYTIEEDVENKKTILTCEATDVPAFVDEPYSPYFRQVADYLQFQVTDLVMIDQKYTAPVSWDEYGEHFQNLALTKSAGDAKQLKKIAREVAGDATTDAQKVSAILKYVRDSVKIGPGRKGDYSKVLKEGSGHAIDISGLTCALLEQAGLESRLLLIHSARDGHFDPKYFAGSQWGFAGVRVLVEGRPRVLLPYMDNLPWNYVPIFLQGQAALAMENAEIEASWDLGDTFKPGKSELWTLPGGDPLDSTSRHVYDLEITPSGDVNTTETITMHGKFAYGVRQSLKDLTEAEEEEVITDQVTFADGDIRLESYTIDNQADYELPLVITASYVIENQVTVTPEEVLFHTGGLFSPLTGVKFEYDETDRQNPIRVYNDESHVKQINIRYPAGWSPATELSGHVLENDFGRLSVTSDTNGDAIHIDLDLHLNTIEAAAERNPEFVELVVGGTAFSVPALVFAVEP